MAREIEVKLLADGASYAEVMDLLKAEVFPNASSFEEGTSIDAYWRALDHAQGKFLRLRVSDECRLTSKTEDRGSIENRKENEVVIPFDKKDEMMEALIATLGDPTVLMWRFADFKLGNSGTTVSIIQNIDKPQFVFVEVEASALEECTKWVQRFNAANVCTFKQVKNSFFDIFVNRHGVLL